MGHQEASISLEKVDSQSYWIATTDKTSYPKLTEDTQVDVAIVGGGMVGITAAYLLKQEGLKVAVVEANQIAQGTTGHTTAKITSQHGLIYADIQKQMGTEKALMYAQANESAISFIHQLVQDKDIQCDFEWHPAYIYTHLDPYVQKIADEAQMASTLGIQATYLESVPLSFSVKAALKFDGQAQFHPRKYLLALAKTIPGEGSYIFEQTRVVDIEESPSPALIAQTGLRVKADSVLIASHYPFYDKPGLYFTRIYPERSYVLGIRAKEKLPSGMYITAEEPGRSLRSQPDKGGEMILVGGEHHKTGHGRRTFTHYENLRAFANEVFTVQDILYRWSTHDCVTPDRVPYIGRLTSKLANIFVATGFRKWGMTHSTVAAMVIRDLIIKEDSPWAPLYNPSRFTPKASASKFLKENIDVAINFVGGKVSGAEVADDVQPNEGKALKIKGQKVGAYRDAKGKLYLVDITCTHLGCELVWNDAETTWDCPCHGSRYKYNGDIVEGPTTKPLPLVEP